MSTPLGGKDDSNENHPQSSPRQDPIDQIGSPNSTKSSANDASQAHLLRLQIQSLKKIMTLKDNEIQYLQEELSKAREHINMLKSQQTEKGFNKHHRRKNSSTSLNPLDPPATQHEHLESSLSPPQDYKQVLSKDGRWKIPERSEKRSQNSKSTHSHNPSITSTTSSHYSLTSPNKQNIPPQLIIDTPSKDDFNQSEDYDAGYQKDDINKGLGLSLNLTNSTPTSDFIAMGSSPRKTTPVRYRFTEDELKLTSIQTVFEEQDATIVTNNTSTTIDKDDKDDTHSEAALTLPPSPQATPILEDSKNDEDFHFSQSAGSSMIEPVYKMVTGQHQNEETFRSPITSRMMMSRTPSENIELISSNQNSVNPRISVDLQQRQQQQLHYITGIDDTKMRPLTPPLLQKPVDLVSQQKQDSPSANLLLSMPQPLPMPIPTKQVSSPLNEPNITQATPISIHKPHQSPELISKPQQQGALNGDSQKFLINSLQNSVIKVETVVDPIALIDSKVEEYWMVFMVYSNENQKQVTPMYRVRRKYNDFLLLDRRIRPSMPFLQQLPEMASIRRHNYRLWEQNKLIIDNYIASTLSYLKRGMPNMEQAKRAFSTYFEFTIPEINHDDDSSFNILNLRAHLDYLLYVKQKFPNKTYDIIQLIFSDDSDILTLKSFNSKSEQIFRDDTVVNFKGQEIILKKKKKFAANKNWILFAQSIEDGEEIGNRLKNWIKDNDEDVAGLDDNFDSQSQSSLPISGLGSPKVLTPNNLGGDGTVNMGTPMSSGTSPSLGWPLFGKRASKIPPVSPKSQSSSPNKDVLMFKSQPYDGVMTTSTSSIHSTGSPKKAKNSGKPPVFEPVGSSSSKYFGNTLQGAFDLCPKYQLGGHDVPSVIFQCLNYLHSHSAEGFEGIFRLNGMMSEVNAIEREFNSHYDCHLDDMTPPPDVYSVATLLKRYLRKVDGGIIIDDISEEMYHIVKTNTDVNQEELNKIKKLVNNLPVMNRDVLFVVFKYIMDVLKQGAHNKMGVNAMSVLIGPNITETRGMPIAVVLMNHFQHIFNSK